MTKNDLADIVLILGAIIAIIVVLLITAGCVSPEHGPDTPQKIDSAGNPNFGPQTTKLRDYDYDTIDDQRSASEVPPAVGGGTLAMENVGSL